MYVCDLILAIFCGCSCNNFSHSQFMWQNAEPNKLNVFSFIHFSLFYHLHHWIKYLASNHRTRVECLITGSACKYVQIVNITNIELMSHSSVKHLSRFAYAFHILHAQIRFCLHVCTSKRHDILLWMTNLLKFTYISECKQSITFC